MKEQIEDLRGALAFLREREGQLIETDTEADPVAEIAGVYRHVGEIGRASCRERV